MKGVIVDRVPRVERVATRNHDLKGFVENFIKGDAIAIKVVYGENEYKDLNSAYKSLWGTVKNLKKVYPDIRVTLYRGDIYLEKI